MKHLVGLWRGEVPLARAFWTDAVLVGSLANAAATILAFATLAADGPGALAAAIFLLPLPYNAFAVIAVWRSARHYHGPPAWANLARIAVVLWAIAATLL